MSIDNLKPCRITVLGAGSFGSVLANIMAKNGHQVSVWLRDETHLQNILSNYENQKYLPDFYFQSTIQFSSDLSLVLENAQFVFLAIPSKAYRKILPQIKPFLSNNAVLVSTAKGIDSDSFKLMTQIVSDELPEFPVLALSGPNLAAEIAKDELTASVIASEHEQLNQKVQNLLSSKCFRVYDNKDIFGVELAGALKNIYAIASGMAHALGMGENARSMLMTRSLAEMSRFAVSKGANPMTFLGLAGVGDLFATCSSPLSRNFRLGSLLAQGHSVEQAMEEIGSTVEGYATVSTVTVEAKRCGVYMPLASALNEVLYNNKNIYDLVEGLMLGENTHDVEFVNTPMYGSDS